MTTRKDKAAFFRTDGKALLPAESAAQDLLRSYQPGTILRAKITRPRRPKYHRFFFAMIASFFDSWPEFHGFQPESEDHLRAWATCKAGYRDVLGENLGHDEGDLYRMVTFIQKALQRSREKHSFVAVHNGSIVLITPKSIAFDALDQAAFSQVAENIFDVLAEESGISIESIKEELDRCKSDQPS